MPKKARNTRLAALQQEARWTNGDLAREVNRLGTLHGLRLAYDRTAVAHWLSGTRPRPPVPELVAEVLSHRLGQLVTPEWTGLTPRQRTAPVSTAHPILALAELAVSEAGNGQQNPSGRLFSVQEIEAELGAAAKLRPGTRATQARLLHSAWNTSAASSSSMSSATGADARQRSIAVHSR
ncbi:hypothetical protein Smic_78290 [Streptomyces microflavus]|uniref:Transcriptional regulator n=1 Tax=Streptomyces microflavus TaxID=1919 RepID=A0A7J0D3G8_STRMI|nr:hypothetical protein Smic_78290 [Streptomyces microflavus]